MSARATAVELASKRAHIASNGQSKGAAASFGCYVFTPAIMEKMLPKEATQNILNARQGKEKLKPEYADAIAVAMREWAISLGASHYCHLFQPLTGTTAEKHESFIDWKTDEVGIDKFSGQELIQGEPDASSFPSGGLRTTFEARGYTGWDPTSPVFVWEAGDGFTLCIPSIFFSWTGDILDNKVPLLRSDAKINDAVLRLLKLTGVECSQVHSTLGWEQEYFVIDRALRDLRPDLVILGRTVFGAPPPKGQELQDHYFGSVKDRILSYMKEFEEASLKLAIPVKTRHNEVAPAQHEVAPVFEKASLAVDHNIMLMELMRRIATKHDLACLLHEKPFDGLNGSGKHNNWSLATDTGINLLNPSGIKGNCTQFVILLTAILSAVHKHADLLRASIGSASNDYRLGGHEAPPAVISTYLGEALEQALDKIVEEGEIGADKGKGSYDFGLSAIPNLARDNTDRNRTSPFAFTGNKFEFRAVGSSASCSLPITIINVIVAESLNEIMDEIVSTLDNKESPDMEEFLQSAIPVMQKHLKNSRGIRFSGDNYSEEWKNEAAKRGLPNIEKCFDAFDAFRHEKTKKAFHDVLTESELISRYDIIVDLYSGSVNIEANLMVELFNTQILPAAIKYQRKLADSIRITSEQLDEPLDEQKKHLKKVASSINLCIQLINKLEVARDKANGDGLSTEERGRIFSHEVAPICKDGKAAVDTLESITDDKLWPLPKYRELLFLV